MGESTFKWIVAETYKHKVVPVIGTELYVDEHEAPLDPILGRELAKELDIKLEKPSTPREVALHWLSKNGADAALYQAFRDVYANVLTRTPLPIEQLAQISDFHFYVTTAVDDRLEIALRAAGRAPQVVSYSPDTPLELPDEPTAKEPSVLHLLGHLEASDFAATEAMVLRRIQGLMRGGEQTRQLNAALNGRDLLFLGCGFPDWLSRFFIHAVTQGIVTEGRSRVIADQLVLEDAHLAKFLSHHHKLILYETGGARALLASVRDKWKPPAPESEPETPMPRGAVFLSFGGDDRADVKAIAAALTASNVDVWFDERELEPGERWRRTIQANIDTADLFVPFISKKTIARAGTHRYVHKEWNHADEVSKSYLGGARFIVPVMLDAISQDEAKAAGLPLSFLECQWIELHGRIATEDFVQKIREALKKKRRTRHMAMTATASSSVGENPT